MMKATLIYITALTVSYSVLSVIIRRTMPADDETKE